MLSSIALQPAPFLDGPTLTFVAVCVAGLLGLFLILVFLQQRNVPALAWWGSAYLIGASSLALWTAPTPMVVLPPVIPSALIFVACGMVWNGVRLFQGRASLPLLTSLGGAILWVALCQVPAVAADQTLRLVLGALVIATYTFCIAFELARERRQAESSRVAAIAVPFLHAGIFLMPLAMRQYLPGTLAASWQTVLALETFIYAIGTAFIVLLMVKDHHVHIYRTAASTDALTGLLNRRAFLEGAHTLWARQASRREPVTVLLFDLDHFKSINDGFGHAVGDDALRVFAQVVRTGMRATDVSGRLGGEEFAAILPGGLEGAAIVAERVRANFEAAGMIISGHELGATVSIGAAVAERGPVDLDGLLARADAALYRAKREGRNRMCAAPNAADAAAQSASGTPAGVAAAPARA
jgi:diguanylate cyclase (GGDEF)-like protein